MTDRARWNGSEAVRVYDPEGSVYDPPIDEVVPGGLLSTDVPARVRDELLKRDGWSRVQHQQQAAGKTDDKADQAKE